MTTNPFSGIITQGLKDLHKNMIDSLLEDTALTRPCRLIYSSTKYDDCPNCIYDPVGKRSSNRHQPGGPVPFQFGARCPVCNGVGRIPYEESEDDIYLCILWDYKQWINFDVTVQSPAGKVQTLSKIELAPKLKRANQIILATDIEEYAKHRFQRDGEPQPCGFGANNYISVLWKRIG
jgi:hypothetical protein